ncbi:Retrovirus-related Pol polyprotein from transposon 297 [Vitis vinifera]|uniref:Retrovirus-related Pol polyprotein from transposon 297 n=1 Tax=Vitis vinifera TaxID=29760 RepID=A0A438GLI2_VITVI|nr:Retrovirus-related Pol polyprotein from transposon 297 [Vitis vinifera]
MLKKGRRRDKEEEEMKGKKKDISEGKEDHDSTVNANPEKELIKEELMKKRTSPPFPQALHGKKGIKNASEILEVLRQVKVNIPLLDMIKQVPTYAKFLKDLCTIKRGLNVNKKAFLTEQPTSITPSLADRSVKIPRGIIEDVLVQVDNFYYPVDFVVLDTDPLEWIMQLTFGNMTLELNIFHMSKKLITPEEEEGPEEVCIIDTLVEEHCDQNMQDELNESLEDLEEGRIPEAQFETSAHGVKIYIPEENNQCPVVISSSLTGHQEISLLKVLKRCKKAIGWQISDLKESVLCPWVSPTQVVPKSQGLLWFRMKKEKKLLHASLQVGGAGESLGHPFYCFLDGYSGYFQIETDVEDQEETTFTCPFGTYAYRRMPFGLCNAPATFQICMLSIFSDMVERIMEVFMDDITIYGGIVLSHIISEKGIEVDKAKGGTYCQIAIPNHCKRSKGNFLAHAGSCTWPREYGKPYVIYYANKTLNEAQRNYTTTEKELLAVVFALDKFRAYLFDLQIRDKKGVENVVANHLSRLSIAHNSHVLPINDDFPEESLMLLEKAPWYAHIANYLVTGEVPREWKAQDRKHFFAKIHAYYWEEPFLFKYCADHIIRKCVPEEEQQGILSHCHENACGGHFASQKTAMKVLQSGFTWSSLFKDSHIMCRSCDKCERLGKLTKRNQMPMNPILIVDLFYVWGINFMGPFPMSFGNSYILVGVELCFQMGGGNPL